MCYEETFILTDQYRTLNYPYEIFPRRGCSSDERNKISANTGNQGIINITYSPRLDYFFPNESYPPLDPDPPRSMTFRFGLMTTELEKIFDDSYQLFIFFGRADDYHSVPKISKRNGKEIQKDANGNSILETKFKITLLENRLTIKNLTSKDFDFYDYEGYEGKVTFDGYKMGFSFENSDFNFKNFIENNGMSEELNLTLLVRVYDTPGFKVQGYYQYKSLIQGSDIQKTKIYTVDTRNVFFQNISMFYNQRVNVTKEGLDPTGEDSGFWINTPCNTPQMATIMVDYFFFDTIHRMQRFGYEFDRLQLRIHTPYYHKTLNTQYSLFRSQWNETYEKPRVFIHPISNYRDHCAEINNCAEIFNYTDWSTNPVWTKYIIDIKNEIHVNQIWINFTELEKIYEADGFHRGKLSININNTMTPHITQITNGLWAELYDPVTQDYVMRTKVVMDETDGYTDAQESDPYRNFYLTCEIPDNITSDDMEFMIKKFGVLQTAHLWFRLDVFNKGITKLYPPRFNVVFRFPPEVYVTNDTFGYTLTYYRKGATIEEFMYYMIKDFREDGLGDGMYTENTFDVKRNQINVSELHPNTPNGDVPSFYTQTYNYLCYNLTEKGNRTSKTCLKMGIKRQFLYYFYDLSVAFNQNGTQPVDITVYHIKYVPYHSKDQINRGLHRWNPHHAGWAIPENALSFKAWRGTNRRLIAGYIYRYYHEAIVDNFYFKAKNEVNYYNFLGSSNEKSYNGSDCIFNLAGGSTMRNTTCSYWNGIIPDKPFTNYARDIYEEHVAYKSVNDDTFRMDNSARTAEIFKCYFDIPYAGRKSSLLIKMHFSFDVPRSFDDSEYLCDDFYARPVKGCAEVGSALERECFKMNYNIHKYTTEYFTKITLPEGVTVEAGNIGLVRDCNYKRYLQHLAFNKKTYSYLNPTVKYLCYYADNKTIYAFNSTSQQGFCNFVLVSDVTVYIDGVYIYENLTSIKKNTGLAEFGFFNSVFWKSPFPRDEDYPLEVVKNTTKYEFKRKNLTNGAFNLAEFEFTVYDEMYWDQAWIMAIENDWYTNFIYTYRNNIGYDGVYDESEKNTSNNWWDYTYYLSMWRLYPHHTHFWDDFEFRDAVSNGTHHNVYFLSPYYTEYYNSFAYDSYYFHKKVRYVKEGQTKKLSLRLQFNNPRSLRPFNVSIFNTNNTLRATFQRVDFTCVNKYPFKEYDIKFFTSSNLPSDRAIYTIKFNLTNESTIVEGDYFEFKTSWRSSYKSFNNTPPDENGYYTQRFYIKETKERCYDIDGWEPLPFDYECNYLINPPTVGNHTIKDLAMYDFDGYLIFVCPLNWTITIDRYIGFKMATVDTTISEIDTRYFDIRINLIPEVAFQPNDTLNLKFSKGVLLSNYTECYIYEEIGLTTTEPDFKCEIKKETNEITIYNALRKVGVTDLHFNNRTSNTLEKQEIYFIIEAVPINRTHDNEEIYSVEIQSLTDGKIKQLNKIPSTVVFKCGYKCKTCMKENKNLCLTCTNQFPFYNPETKECLPHCSSNYFSFYNNETKNTECKKCNNNCKTCSISENNCTSCDEPYYLENETCVLKCSEGNSPDEKIRKCYPITYINGTHTIIQNHTIYVNVSVPEYIYVDKNCSVPNDTDKDNDGVDDNKNKTQENDTKSDENDEKDKNKNDTNLNGNNNTKNDTNEDDKNKDEKEEEDKDENKDEEKEKVKEREKEKEKEKDKEKDEEKDDHKENQIDSDKDNNGTDANKTDDDSSKGNGNNDGDIKNKDNNGTNTNETDKNGTNNNNTDSDENDANNNGQLQENDLLINKFKFKMPFDYFIIPIASVFILILLEILKCCCIDYYAFIFSTYLIIGLATKANLVLTYLFSFKTGYEPFFYIIASIIIIHMYLTFTFLLVNICIKNSTLRSLIPRSYLYILSLVTAFITDFKNFEIYTRSTVEQKKESVKIVEISPPQKNEKETSISNDREHHKDKTVDITIKDKCSIYKYTLIQNTCINTLLISSEWIFVHLPYWVLAIYIFITYKTFSFLWWCCIYGIFLFILNVIFYIRFLKIEYIDEHLDEKNREEIESQKSEKSEKSEKTDIQENDKFSHDGDRDSKRKHKLPPPIFPKSFFEISHNSEFTYRGLKPENGDLKDKDKDKDIDMDKDKDKDKENDGKTIPSERKSLNEDDEKEKHNKNDFGDTRNINISVNKNININDNRSNRNNDNNDNKNNNINENKNNNINDNRNNNNNDNNMGPYRKISYNDYLQKERVPGENKCICPCHYKTDNVTCICKNYEQFCPKHHRGPSSSHQLLYDDCDIIHNDNTNYNIFKNYGSPEKSEHSLLNRSSSKDNVVKRKIVCKIDEFKVQKERESDFNPINYRNDNKPCLTCDKECFSLKHNPKRSGLTKNLNYDKEKSFTEYSDINLNSSIDQSSIIYNPSREDISYLSDEKK